MTTSTDQKANYIVDQYDASEREWVWIGYKRTQDDAYSAYASTDRSQGRVRIQKWTGSAWVTVKDSNTEAQ